MGHTILFHKLLFDSFISLSKINDKEITSQFYLSSIELHFLPLLHALFVFKHWPFLYLEKMRILLLRNQWFLLFCFCSFAIL